MGSHAPTTVCDRRLPARRPGMSRSNPQRSVLSRKNAEHRRRLGDSGLVLVACDCVTTVPAAPPTPAAPPQRRLRHLAAVKSSSSSIAVLERRLARDVTCSVTKPGPSRSPPITQGHAPCRNHDNAPYAPDVAIAEHKAAEVGGLG